MISPEFLTAGHAIFTVANATGTHYTYRVTRKDPDPSGPYASQGPVYFVGLLTGPDNTSSYTYMGMLDLAGRKVRLTKASRYTTDTVPVRVFNWAMAIVMGDRALPDGYAIHHEGKCGRCGRTLTVPASILTGLGPDCAAMMGLGVAA